jgi:hypothetical protein
MAAASVPADRLVSAGARPDRLAGPANVLIAAGAAIVSMVVYRGVLGAYFWSDDFTWLYILHDRSLAEFLFTPIGGHSPVARNAVFALTNALAGFDPRPYFAVVLLTHGLNAGLLATLIQRLTGRPWVAAIGAAAWGTCPAASGTLDWYSAYQEVAATTCILLLFLRLTARSDDGGALARRDLAVISACLGLSLLFSGTAVAVALALPLVIALLSTASRRGGERRVIAVSAGVLGLYLLLQGLGTRVYGAPNVAIDVVCWCARSPARVVKTGVHLVRVGLASLLLGSWWRPGDRSDLPSWLALAGGAAGLMTGYGMASPQRRRVLLAFIGLAIVVYALVALARGPASAFLLGTSPAEVGATLRYHYIAQAFLAVALCVATDAVARSGRSMLAGVGAACWALALAAGALVHPVSIDRHDAARIEVARALESLRDQLAAVPPEQAVYIRNEPITAFGWMPNTFVRPPGLAALFIIAVEPDELGGRRVQFIEPNSTVIDLFARPGVRMAKLLVPPSTPRR